tara:strand:- start:127 stop:738 length:612 start_codon:yes stop_codon:yes gene_type:complete
MMLINNYFIKIFLAILFLVFNFQTSINADDIKEFEIEGFNLGVSLLEYFNKNEIENNIDYDSYAYTDQKYVQVNIYEGNFGDYEVMQFTIKKNDKKYIIHSIAGGIFYSNFDKCLKKQKKISNEILKLFTNADKLLNKKGIMPGDKSGESYAISDVYFINGGSVSVRCFNWSEKLTREKNWTDNLRVGIRTDEFNDWGVSFNN